MCVRLETTSYLSMSRDLATRYVNTTHVRKKKVGYLYMSLSVLDTLRTHYVNACCTNM
jgi:hypothetical protein